MILNRVAVEQVEKKQAARRHSAQDDYKAGIDRLAQAQAEAFQNMGLLKEAYRTINQAHLKDKQNTEYQSTLAYILILVGEEARAKVKLETVLEQEPNNQTALELYASLFQISQLTEQDHRLSRWNAFQALPIPQSEAEFDYLYDRVEAFINEEVLTVMQATKAPQVTLNEDKVQEQTQLFEEMTALKEMIETKFEILYEEFDIPELKAKCRPLDIYIKNLSTTVSLNQQMEEIFMTIVMISQALEEMMKHLSHESIQDNSERIFDLCDDLADQLDDLSHHTDISEIEAIYEGLLAEVNRFQEALDA